MPHCLFRETVKPKSGSVDVIQNSQPAPPEQVCGPLRCSGVWIPPPPPASPSPGQVVGAHCSSPCPPRCREVLPSSSAAAALPFSLNGWIPTVGKASYVKIIFRGFLGNEGCWSGSNLTWNKKTNSNFGGIEGGMEQKTPETISTLLGFIFIWNVHKCCWKGLWQFK